MHRRIGRTALAASMVSVTVALTACGGVDPRLESGAPQDAAQPAAAATTEASGPQPDPLTTSTSAVGELSRTIVGWINSDPATLDRAAIGAAAGPEFAAATGPDGLYNALVAFSASAPFSVAGFTERGDQARIDVTTRRGAPLTFDVAVGPGGTVAGLLAQPVAPPVGSWRDISGDISALGVVSSVQASRITGGVCQPVFATNPGARLPLGSIFKLYVLGALARAVDAGTVGWDEPLTITDAIKSAPSGTYQNLPAGTVVTVRQAAENMISISDNTAADLLITRLGRPAVENEVALMGASDPASLVPFPTTREVFLVGWGLPNQRDAWRTADTEQRRQILASTDARPLDLDLNAIVTSPATADGVGWYTTAGDICAAYAALTSGPQSAEVQRILAINPAVQLDPAQWPYVGYKGGNLPGEFAQSWVARDASGQLWSLSWQLQSPEPIGTLDGVYVSGLAAAAFGLMR